MDDDDDSTPPPEDTITLADLSEYLSPREAKPIAILRCTVILVWLAAACAVSYGVFSYTRHAEWKEFEIQYQVDANKVLERFHATIDKRLGAANTLATALTIHAKYTNQTFPFVTMNDFVVPGSTARILADAAIIHWLPLVTDENREEWEAYAYQHRQQVDDEFEKDEAFRRQEDIRLGLVSEQDRLRALQEEEEESSLSSLNNTNSSAPIVDNVVQDGSKYHYRIWSPEKAAIIPDGNGPYLPIWQRSPVNAARQSSLNIDMGSARGLAGIFPYWSDQNKKPQGALLQRAIIPHPNVKAFHDQILFSSQYRHHAGPYQNTPTTKLSYPVFDGFGDDAKFVGVLATTLYWRLSFTDIFHYNSARGLICVVESTFGQIFSYRVDGPNATYLGEGDPLVNNTGFFFEDMMVTHSENFKSPRPQEERLSYTTLPLDDDYSEYKLKIYATQDTYSVYQHNRPMIYTILVASIFLLAAVVFLLYDFFVQKRQKTMMAKAIEQAHRAAIAEREAAIAERELNEYLAHEVRNPLAAALSACSFVSSAVNETEPMQDEASKEAVRDDVHIITSSLNFMNDLLRNMLDLHRAVNDKVKIRKHDTDLYHDVLEPVMSMLYCRDDNFELILDCPKNLIVQTDSLRLKQVILNLGRNAAKFVSKGFVRLRAEVVTRNIEHDKNDNTSQDQQSSVRIYVEDSGPGIPAEKRNTLFAKFQESLDLLSQGTGIGLCLCKQLTGIMGADLWLDENYDSGIDGCPGISFVVDLNTASRTVSGEDDDDDDEGGFTDTKTAAAVVVDAANVTRITPPGSSPSSDIFQEGQLFNANQDLKNHSEPLSGVDLEAGSGDGAGNLSDDTDNSATTQGVSDSSSDAKEDLHADLPPFPSAREQNIPSNVESNTTATPPTPIMPAVQTDSTSSSPVTLPEELSVLFVDDDRILRKLFIRSIKKLQPNWKVQEASSGETAIRLIEDMQVFDIIFMDQYMASTQKQLLGTETVRQLRAKGVTCKICGLSANDAEKAFLNAGADGFLMKPIPCDKTELETALIHLLYGGE